MYNQKVDEKYRHSKKGLIKVMYQNQRRRSKEANMLMGYNLLELRDWVMNNLNFNRLYAKWVESKYNRNYVPSIDRIDPRKWYTFDNIQLISCLENNKKRLFDLIIKPEKRNISGTSGVYITYSKSWRAELTIKGKKYYKIFKTMEEAITYRKQLELELL